MITINRIDWFQKCKKAFQKIVFKDDMLDYKTDYWTGSLKSL
jgi:hypothetical protein